MGVDILQWQDGGKAFTLKACYEKILNFRLRHLNFGVLRMDWSKVWLEKVPTKVYFLFGF